jgi:Nucleotide modification associated domain 1
MSDTNNDYDKAVAQCSSIFLKKVTDYGTAWRVLRTISVVDQIFIKALRIRTIQEKKSQRVNDSIASEFKGIVNYSVIGLTQLQLGEPQVEDLAAEKVEQLYKAQVHFAKSTMQNKNHDYGEAWRSMSQESFVDLILMKLMRIKQILQNDGKTLISEGIDANYVDILNYAVFALILMDDTTLESEK